MRLSVKSTVVVLALAAFAACGKNQSEGEVTTVHGALLPDETTPIGQKWRQLVTAGVPIGEATNTVQNVPGYPATYQTFVQGVIVFTNDHGAVYLTQAIFDKWQSLTTMLDAGGNPVYGFFGVPTADYVTVAGHDDATFTGGMIVVSGGVGRVIFGGIYLKYLAVQTALGAPTSEEADAMWQGGRFQTFAGGDIYWGPTVGGAFAIFAGPVLNRFHTLTVAGIGLPLNDSGPIVAADGTQRGLVGRFQNGGIYFNAATGNTFDVSGGLFQEYERQGGPNGWLGFPTNVSSYSPGASHFLFNDFEGGVLVWYETIPAIAPALPTYRVAAFGNLAFHLERVTARGDDCVTCGKQDLYFYLDVSTSNGVVVNHERMPGSGPFCQGCDTRVIDQDWSLGIAKSTLTVNAAVNVWDDDDLGGGDDDNLGTPSATFNIDNLWGLKDANVRDNGDGRAEFNVKTSHAFQENDFRGQKYWSFINKGTPDLGYDLFADAFEDVTPDEHWYFNPFNAMYYGLFFKSVAEGGNCAGMNTEAYHAGLGGSQIGMPIHDAFADTQDGSPLDAANPIHAPLLRTINIKQGFQLGIDSIAWRVGRFFSGSTHDPGGVFNESYRFFTANDAPTLSIYDDIWYGNGHSLLPYAWDHTRQPCKFLGAAQCVRIYVADPNFPTKGKAAQPDGTRPGTAAEDDHFVEVSETGDEYYYAGNGVNYTGGQVLGGRMFFVPGHITRGTQVTPFYEPYLLATAAFIMIVADDGAAQQITDASGRTFFEPGISGVPTRWDQVRQDPTQRVPDIAPVMPPDTKQSLSRGQLWYGQGFGATHTYDIAAKPGVAAGTPIESAFHAGTLSSRFSVPATVGKADKVIASQINTFNKTIAFELPAGSTAKPITWTISGTEKQRWAEFSSLGMTPAQRIKMYTANAGKKVLINNNGASTTAHLRVKGGPGGTIVDLGTVTIPGGDSVVDFQGPKTTLTMGGVVNGQNGWLVAPVTITLDVQDRGGFGIDATEWSTDNVTWTKYTGPFAYSAQGVTTFYYRSRDKGGNVEPSNSQAFKIDTNLPTTTGSVSTTGGVKLTYAVTDPTPGSGVAGVHIVQGAVSSFLTAASGTAALSGTCSAVEFWGEDVAGNMSTPHQKRTDSVPPVFTTVPPPTINTTLCTVAAGLNLGTAAATDDCGPVTPTNDAPAKFPLGTTIVTWTAKDAAGNITTKTTVVTTDLGDDVSCCPTGTNIIKGTSNNDTLNGTSGADCILGLGGQDVIKGNAGNDAISGGNGDDDIWGGDGNDWLAGGQGQDKLRGENGNDTLSGGDGDDTCWGGNNDDRLIGGLNQDNLMGEAGNDTLEGNAGYDTMNGGTGNDFLRGGSEIDNLNGGGGTDQCVQDGADTLTACTAVAP